MLGGARCHGVGGLFLCTLVRRCWVKSERHLRCAFLFNWKVRFGSESEILKANQRVRFAPTSGHSLRQVASALQSGVVERRSFGFALTFLGFALTFLVYRGVVVRGGGVTTD
jgi:hypothetical protein